MNGSGNRGASPAGMALLRAAVAGYLIYLGVTLIRDRLNGKSAMAPWLAWACGTVFVLAGAAFGWFAWRRYRADTADRPGNAGEPEAAGTPEVPEGPKEAAGPKEQKEPARPEASPEEKGTSS